MITTNSLTKTYGDKIALSIGHLEIPKGQCFGLVGNNGAGKTNLLDAIYYLAFCKSYFNPADSQLIKHDEAFMVLQGEFEKNDSQEKIYAGLKKGQKNLGNVFYY